MVSAALPAKGVPVNTMRDLPSRSTLNCAGIETAGAPTAGPMMRMIASGIRPEKSRSVASVPASLKVLLPNSPTKT